MWIKMWVLNCSRSCNSDLQEKIPKITLMLGWGEETDCSVQTLSQSEPMCCQVVTQNRHRENKEKKVKNQIHLKTAAEAKFKELIKSSFFLLTWHA